MGSYVAYVLDKDSRDTLLKAFPPKFPDVIAEHVTVRFGVSEAGAQNFPLGEVKEIDVIAYCCDESLECVAVWVGEDGTRPDGKQYHITLSLDRSAGRKPAHSNDVLKSVAPVPLVPFTLSGTLQYL